MRLVFRFDDFGFDATGETYAVNEQLFNMFMSFKMPMVVGVIPNRSAEISNPHNHLFYSIEQDAPHMRLLRRALVNGFQLALHGLTHQTCMAGVRTEYANRSYEDQLDSLKKGVDHLSGILPNTAIDIFIPPWNSFDRLTVTAVGDVGIRVLSGGEDIKAYDQNGVLVIPSFSLKGLVNYVGYHSLDSLAGCVGNSNLTITIHSYDFVGNAPVSWHEFSALLHDIQRKKIDVGILATDAEPVDFVPQHERLVRARLDLLAKGSTGIGKLILRTGWLLKGTVGTPVGESVLDVVAHGVQMLKAIRNGTRSCRGGRSARLD